MIVGGVFVLILSLDHFRVSLVKAGKTQEPAKRGCKLDKTETAVEREGLKLYTAGLPTATILIFEKVHVPIHNFL